MKALGTDYLDLFLAHWPLACHSEPDFERGDGTLKPALEPNGAYKLDLKHCTADIAAVYGAEGRFVPTWAAMKDLVRSGKCRAIGVSNFSIVQLQELLPHADLSGIPISCNQVEINPFFPNDELLAFMKERDILGVAYSPMAGEKTTGITLPNDETVKRVAEESVLGIEQVLLGWAVMRGTVPVGRSSNVERMERSLRLRELRKEDFEALNGIQKMEHAGRTVNPTGMFGFQVFPPANVQW